MTGPARKPAEEIAATGATANLALTLTVEQLRELVRKAVREELTHRTQDAPAVLTLEQAAKLLDMHPKVVVKYARTGGLPSHKIGPEWRFLRSELIGWVASSEVA